MNTELFDPPIIETDEPQPKHEGRLKVESMAALLGEPEPALEWLIEGLWTDKSRGLIAGHPGVGKTWLALDMLLSVATGTPCLGRYSVAGAAPCLLIEEEASRHNLQRRIHALARARGIADSQLTDLYHITRQFAKVPRDTEEICNIVRSAGIKLIVFDSLRRFHTCNENSSSEMQAVLDSFGMISAETEASVILIHHLSKSTGDKGPQKSLFERMRGSGDLWAWRDCIIGVEGEEDADTATCSFQFRDAETPGPIRIKRTVNPSSGAISMTSLGMEESEDFKDRSEAILGFMRTQFLPVSKDKILTEAGGRKQENGRVFKLLEKKGFILKEGTKYFLPENAGTVGTR